ncbi:MAG: biotin--[acetyl-CoA-carboxylase] ligase [Rhodocyclaceae bacterium]|nr:biotin--[acetyl-CoA-carboxylase] ligase [Rhodocyclaceae bacterium]
MPILSTSPLDPAAISAALGDCAQGFSIRALDQCDSTNSRLMREVPRDDGRVHVLVCERQTAGRGRRGRQWLSSPGASLTFSMRWRLAPGSPAPAGLSLVAGLAVARTLEALGVAAVGLKWPNDVLVPGGKLAGILVELASSGGTATHAVIGIGVNLARPQDAVLPEGQPIAALDQLLTSPPSREHLLAALLLQFDALLETYAAAGFAAFRGAWEQRNAHAGLPVRVGDEASSFEGVCLGVADDGALRLQTEAGERRVVAGDVSLRPLP